ncbi:MAG: O-antigen ligase [Halioglobus sp.]|jgi:O-antigen ligase
MLANKFIDKMDTQKTMYTAITVAIVLCSVIALYSSNFVLAAIPVGILGVFATIKDYRILYYGFWAVLPFSVEVYLGSFGTDLPTEPIMLGLTGIAILVFITKMSSVSLRHLQHPISILIILHLGWMFFTCLFSRSPVISYKFFLAKLWYVIPFFFLSFHMIKDVANVHLIFKILSVFLTAAISIVLIRHAIDGFTFMGSHHVVRPIFRNHVNYSAIVVAVLPFMWALYKNTESGYYKKALILVLILFVFGTYFSYTRAAQLCVFISIGAFFIFKYKLGKLAITGSCIVAVLLTTYLSINNKYLDFAPEFETTVAHKQFDNLIEATLKMEDVSTMERVYRWVAGSQMIQERPWTGFGPSSFYTHYTKYTVRSFETYVSDNPEKSGIHSYYFMTLVEQGVIGLLIFLGLIFSVILGGERVYHQLNDEKTKRYIMAATLSTVVICALCLINDLIEADKIGPFFFLNASLIVIFDFKSRSKIREPEV